MQRPEEAMESHRPALQALYLEAHAAALHRASKEELISCGECGYGPVWPLPFFKVAEPAGALETGRDQCVNQPE